MIPFLQALNKEFKEICFESYLEYNTADTVSYPYLTYKLSSEELENQEGFSIEVDIYDDCGADTVKLESLTQAVKKYFSFKTILTEDVLLQFQYETSKCITTDSKTIKGNNIEIYCKVDWRN